MADLALRYLTEGAAGRPCADLAVALAEAVLADEGVRLALEVLDGGDFMHRRATELAARVLEAATGARRGRKSG